MEGGDRATLAGPGLLKVRRTIGDSWAAERTFSFYCLFPWDISIPPNNRWREPRTACVIAPVCVRAAGAGRQCAPAALGRRLWAAPQLHRQAAPSP